MKAATKFLIFSIFTVFLVLIFSSLNADELSGKTYYTKTNIWYENPNDILSTNYHRGTILPFGTKVSIHSIKNNRIRFTPEGSGQLFTIINSPKTSTITTEELFKRYFSTEPVRIGAGDYQQVTEADRDSIRNGIVEIGMSKKAVLMSYGYPPTHKTPLLTSDIWYYWYARLHRVNVYFKDDKVFKIEKIEPAEFPGFTKSTVDSEGGFKKKVK
jgi:hypothetical protein